MDKHFVPDSVDAARIFKTLLLKEGIIAETIIEKDCFKVITDSLSEKQINIIMNIYKDFVEAGYNIKYKEFDILESTSKQH